MAQILIVGDSFYLVQYYLFDISLYAIVVLVNHLIHTIVTIFISKVRNDRDRLVGFGFFGDFGVVNNDFCMENLLVDALVEIVRDSPNNA